MTSGKWEKGDPDRRKERTLSEADEEVISRIVSRITGTQPKLFGFTWQELFRAAMVFIAVGIGYNQMNVTVSKLADCTTYLMKFAQNSDAYHSAVLGTQFEQGKPANPAYDTKAVRDNIIRGRQPAGAD